MKKSTYHRTKSASADEGTYRALTISFPPDVAGYLDADAHDAGLTRSAYVTRLVRKEHARKEQLRARRQQATESPPASDD